MSATEDAITRTAQTNCPLFMMLPLPGRSLTWSQAVRLPLLGVAGRERPAIWAYSLHASYHRPRYALTATTANCSWDLENSKC